MITTQNNHQHDPDSMRADIISLIGKQRMLRLVEGGRFLKYTAKGQRVKDRFWMCRLSPNHRTLHYGDIEDNRKPQLDELPNKINVTDMRRILVGKDCPHTKDGYMKKTSIDLAFTIIYESDHEDNLNFVCSDYKTFCYWTDGLNVLLKLPMASDEFQRDIQMLTKIEQKVRSMN